MSLKIRAPYDVLGVLYPLVSTSSQNFVKLERNILVHLVNLCKFEYRLNSKLEQPATSSVVFVRFVPGRRLYCSGN